MRLHIDKRTHACMHTRTHMFAHMRMMHAYMQAHLVCIAAQGTQLRQRQQHLTMDFVRPVHQ